MRERLDVVILGSCVNDTATDHVVVSGWYDVPVAVVYCAVCVIFERWGTRPTWSLVRGPPAGSPSGSPSVHGCTPSGPCWPPLGSARPGRLSIPGVREVGALIEGVQWWWWCAPVPCRVPYLLVSFPFSLSTLLLPVPHPFYPPSARLATFHPCIPSNWTCPMRAIRFACEWNPH
jgi:hypothetical protein